MRESLSADVFDTPGMCSAHKRISLLAINPKILGTSSARAELLEYSLLTAATVATLSDLNRLTEIHTSQNKP